MLLTAYTIFHVLISLLAILFGFIFLFRLLSGKEFPRLTSIFLATTLATSITGFFFPFHGITPAIILGLISLVVLAVAIFARYPRALAGPWRKTFVISSVLALYLNVFVLVVQSFQKIPALKEIAPTQDAPAFKVTQLVVLLVFIVLGALAVIRFRPQPLSSSKPQPTSLAAS